MQILDCTSFVVLLLARHSPSAAFGSQGKKILRFVQNDKVGLSRWDDRSRSGRMICCRRCSALRAVRAAASRSGGPQACPAGCARHSVRSKRIDIRSINHCSHPPPHSSERLLHSACYGLPLPGDGRVGRRRHRWTQLVGVLTYYRSFPGGFAMVRFGLHGGAEFYASLACSFRALRPSICTEVVSARLA